MTCSKDFFTHTSSHACAQDGVQRFNGKIVRGPLLPDQDPLFPSVFLVRTHVRHLIQTSSPATASKKDNPRTSIIQLSRPAHTVYLLCVDSDERTSASSSRALKLAIRPGTLHAAPESRSRARQRVTAGFLLRLAFPRKNIGETHVERVRRLNSMSAAATRWLCLRLRRSKADSFISLF